MRKGLRTFSCPKVRRESGYPDRQTTHQLLCGAARARLCDFMWATADATLDLEENHRMKIAHDS